MNMYTQHVVDDAAERRRYKVSDIQVDATSTLTCYVFEKSGLPPDAVNEDSWHTALQTVRGVVDKVWADPQSRQHIREIAALYRLLATFVERGETWSRVLVDVGDDLNLSGNWPEFRDAERLFQVTQLAAPRRRRFRSLLENQINPNQITSNPSWNSWKIGGFR
jgi:hypothetical protein